MCVYIPSNEVLFKMMRACIGCENIEDLWFYHDKFSFSTMRNSLATEVIGAANEEIKEEDLASALEKQIQSGQGGPS